MSFRSFFQYTFVAVCISFVGWCQPESVAADWRQDAFPIQSHDFGSVAVSSKTEFYFPVHNTLDRRMHLASIRTSCGCTTATIMDEYIEPGQTGYIHARFNTGTHRGKKAATLTVVIDQPMFTEMRLRVGGYIRSDVVFNPGSLDFGSSDESASTTQQRTTQINYAGRSDWQIVDVRANREWIVPTFVETARSRGRVQYDVTVSIAPGAPQGFFQDEVSIITNDRNLPKIPLRIGGKIAAAIEVSPGSISLGKIVAGEANPKRLVVLAQSPITIESITAPDWKIDFPETDKAKKSHVLMPTFTFKGTQAAGERLTTPVTITTGGSESLTSTVTLMAEIE